MIDTSLRQDLIFWTSKIKDAQLILRIHSNCLVKDSDDPSDLQIKANFEQKIMEIEDLVKRFAPLDRLDIWDEDLFVEKNWIIYHAQKTLERCADSRSLIKG
jgi:hypothetical protein